MLWDPTLNDTALISDFLEGYYGPAAVHMRAYMDVVADAASPSSDEVRFAQGDCVHVADRQWAAGGEGEVTMAHPDGTYDVHLTSADRAPSHPHAVSWVYLRACTANSGAARDTAGAIGSKFVDMVAESCAVPQNGSHDGWACGYLTPAVVMRGLRAQIAAAAAPGLSAAQAVRVARSSLSMQYVALVKWEELRAWACQSSALHDMCWPLPESKDVAFAQFVASLRSLGILRVGDRATWTASWLRDRVFFGNASAAERAGRRTVGQLAREISQEDSARARNVRQLRHIDDSAERARRR